MFNERTFLKDDETKYILPSDKKEVEREAISYTIRKHLFGGNYCSPVEKKLKAGFWVVDMGLDYSSSTFVGIDLGSTQFPSDNMHPSNVGFLACNITHGIPFPPETFDYVHLSMMCCALTESQWSQLIKDMVRVLKYDGWIEIIEGDPWFKNSGRIGKLISETCININIQAMIPKFFNSINELRDLQYIDVEYPLGDWSGCLGKFAMANIRRACEGIVYIQKHLGLSTKEYDDLLCDFEKEAYENRSLGFYHRYFARKARIDDSY
ncbi:24875_t:CDS:2 [Cetraspora pellucida]|uniref:24875_t:CDS:1 n=1 Tax=Cetraspora pellucida TaxID=1433469 RepID=A0A9N9AIV8_9GLOM|nr:24875_t:CDS:2 [Cetraspora pellucida]